ncbi:MAG TPA: S8 family serine peptidase, partial [Planctomycetota bacterium]|nr:S8 family serine peptidase [Planctomycetota bacterium]
HATAVAQYGFGSLSSIAPGISLIDAYEANHWLGAGFLNGSGATPPLMVAAKIFSHSWIGNAGAANNAYLRKLDAVIVEQGLVVCAGVNNGFGPLDVALLSHAFNVIAVGRSDGWHHAGKTSLGVDGEGRMKPELVAPAGATSYATPLVSGAAALLVETAWTDPRTSKNPRAALPEVIKAVLMAGAQHRPGWSNGVVSIGNMRGATATPLDPVFGADQIDVDTSHWILTAGEQAAAQSAPLAQDALPSGWSEIEIGSGRSRWLRFRVEATKPFVSIVLAWNRAVASDYASWSLADLDLELWAADAQGIPIALLGTPAGAYFAGGNVVSDSTVDNVEHLYVIDLAPGEYLLEVRRAQDALPSTRAAIAWNFACASPVVYGTAKTNSLGTTPALRWTGVPSFFGNDFELTLSNGAPHGLAFVLESSSPGSTPFRGGTLALLAPIRRLASVHLDSTGAARVQVAITPEMVGTKRDYQAWFRDPAQTDGTGVGSSDALEVQFCY